MQTFALAKHQRGSVPTKTSRAIGIAKAFALAIAAALLGTVAHQTVIGGFPFGLALALLGALGLALNLRKRNGRFAVTVFAIILGLLVFWIGMDFHQDKMIPANLWGFVWAYGSIALTAMVAIWPRFSR
jgi:hypothetical protein